MLELMWRSLRGGQLEPALRRPNALLLYPWRTRSFHIFGSNSGVSGTAGPVIRFNGEVESRSC